MLSSEPNCILVYCRCQIDNWVFLQQSVDLEYNIPFEAMLSSRPKYISVNHRSWADHLILHTKVLILGTKHPLINVKLNAMIDYLVFTKVLTFCTKCFLNLCWVQCQNEFHFIVDLGQIIWSSLTNCWSCGQHPFHNNILLKAKIGFSSL